LMEWKTSLYWSAVHTEEGCVTQLGCDMFHNTPVHAA
jgi:hypothetical protein